MKTTKAIITIFLSLLIVSCAKENLTEQKSVEQEFVTFNATMATDATKTYLDGVQVKWQASDSVSLWYGKLDSAMVQSNYFVGSVDAGDARIATLKGFATESPAYMAVYPLSAAVDCSKKGKLTVNLPAEQALTPGSFAPKVNVSVAYSATSSLSFLNIGGMMALKVSATGGHTITGIRLVGTSALSGEVEIKQSSITASNPDVDAILNGVNYLTLNCGEGIYVVGGLSGSNEEFIEEPGDWGDVVTKSGALYSTKSAAKSGDNIYYLVSLPGTHNGFVLTFVDSEGKAAVLRSGHAFTIERNSNTLIAKVSLTDADFKSDPQVYINEVDCGNKKIELYNPGSESVDLSGWVLTKDENSWAFPVGSTIAAGGYMTVNCKQSDCGTGPMFGISGDKGFDLKLSNGSLVDRIDNLTSVTTIVDGETYGRRTDGTDDWVVFSAGTIYESGVCDGDNSKGTVKGDTPVVQSDVVLNEVDGNVKFIELYNKGTESVSLNGWTLEKNDGAVWTGTSENSIAAGAHFVVYSSKCESIPAGAPVFSGGISSKQTLKVALKMAGGNVTDTFTRGSSPWGTTISSCSNAFGRTPDGSGEWKLVVSTPGAANGDPQGDIPQN